MINPILASTAFNATGLEAIGHASAQLSAKWADSRPTADESGLSLNLSAPWLAPIDGYLTWSRVGSPALTDHTGAPLSGAVAVLRFHPQGALRLQRLIAGRYDGGAHRRPTPFFAAIRGGTPPSATPTGKPGPPDTMRAGDDLGPGRLTFHDDRGLVIDPIAVACMFRDLLEAMPPLHRRDEGTDADVTDATRNGSLAQIAALGDPRVRLHLVDLFGNPWNDESGREGVRLGTGGRLDGGVHDWTDALDTTGPDIRAGLLPDGELAPAAIEVPALPTGTGAPALDREFFRAAVVDLALHLHGNRTDTAVDGVPGVDATTAAEPAPPLGTGDLTVLTTGQHFLGAAGQIARAAGTRLAASPRIDDDFALPADDTERWPLAPAPLAAAEDLTGEHAARARAEATAAYIGATPDVLVSWPAGALPVEAFVRVFPRVDPGRATVPLALLNFSTRGDGGGAIVPPGGECRVRVPDPYLVGTSPRPTAPGLVFDLLIVTRGPAGGRERLFGSIHLDPIGEGGTDPTPSAAPNAFAAIPDDHCGISPAPVLGLEPTAPPSGFDLVLDAFGAAAPRQSPRFATMARTETVVAGHDGTTPDGWTSLIGPGHLTEAFMAGDARRGSPGLPAGPEEHAPAVQATGPLAQHLARAALRRTHHLVARLIELDDGRWDAATGTAGNATGAILQTVAPTVESPELKAALQLVDVDTLPGDWAGLMGAVGGLLPPPLNALTSMTPDAGDRWVAEFKREARAANQGRRDAQWAWRWAIAHARRLVYLETTLLSPTAAATEDHKVDLVALLGARLTTAPDLRVVLVTPRRIPFGTGYESFAQRMHLERQAAVTTLHDAFPDRVVAYHPVGFPGRPENLRGTFAVVDDVWALVGGSTFSRRGLTFDGSCDLAFVGHDLKDGVSAAVREARRIAMARVLGVGPREPGSTATPDPRWTQLNGPRRAFDLMKRTVAAGGEGEVQPRWDGLPTTELPALAKDIADPEGREFSSALTGLAGILAGLGTGRL